MAPLIVASVPIGNPGDATDRLREAIRSSEIIAVEDSRKFSRLANDLDLTYSGKVISFFEGNEGQRTGQMLDDLGSGKQVLLISDAGTPALNDPGYSLISQAIEAGIEVVVLPGPSAITTALLNSGFTTDTFAFEGFVPRSLESRRVFFERLKLAARTTVAFESPHRLAATLNLACEVLGGDKKVAICREMTKKYEEIFRGSLDKSLEWLALKESEQGIKGEITLVFAAIIESHGATPESILEAVGKYETNGMSTRDAVHELARELSMSKRYIYDLVIKERDSR